MWGASHLHSALVQAHVVAFVAERDVHPGLQPCWPAGRQTGLVTVGQLAVPQRLHGLLHERQDEMLAAVGLVATRENRSVALAMAGAEGPGAHREAGPQ